MPGECYSIEAITNFVSRDINRIIGEIMMHGVRRLPWTDVLATGVLENQMGYTFRSVIQEPSVAASGLTVPTVTLERNNCRNLGGIDKTGTREYTIETGVIRNRSQEICVLQAKTAFKSSYLRTAASLRDTIMKVKAADIRGQVFQLSGIKASVVEGLDFEDTIAGSYGALETDFISTQADSYVTFKYLKKLANVMYDDLMAEPWSEGGIVAKWIGSRDSVDVMRDELDVRADIRAMITGRYQVGKDAFDGFSWDGPYEGISFGVDPQPLRAEIGGGGPNVEGTNLQLVEPEIEVATTNGVGARVNPAWSNARWELGALVFANSFKRMSGKNWLGEGDVKFPHQLAIDQLVFKSIEDNDCNWFGDMGRFGYQITRAYEPVMPSNVAFVLYKRCKHGNNWNSCDSNLNVL